MLYYLIKMYYALFINFVVIILYFRVRMLEYLKSSRVKLVVCCISSRAFFYAAQVSCFYRTYLYVLSTTKLPSTHHHTLSRFVANNEEIHSSILHSTLLDLQLLINIMSVEEIPEVRSHPTLYYRLYIIRRWR